MLKTQIFIVAALIATVCADIATPTVRFETAPGIICPMTVCPTSTLLDKRAIACPASCPDNCRIIDDVCCPGNQKAICSSSSSESNSDTSVTPTASSSPIPSSSVAPSSSVITTTPGPASSIPASGASSSVPISSSLFATSFLPSASGTAGSSPASSSGNTVQLTMSGSIIAVAIVAGFHYF
ncbi:hypothetical protein G6F56_008735 [Rhizopus delemar]|nr:hypothetical protein G6F56_008735 [Rhizopus delemar]